MPDDIQLLREHQRSWGGFVKLTIWCLVSVIVILALMALFLL
ncbi:MAG: aa3-type cytochrome c oxidase subunit IV [Pseudomonadota bacterium]